MNPHGPAFLAFVGSKLGKGVTNSVSVGGGPIIVIFAHGTVQKSSQPDWRKRRREGS